MLPEITPARLAPDVHTTPPASVSPTDARIRLRNAERIFLDEQQLPVRWQRRPQFVMVAQGFGDGLHFLSTWRAWERDPFHCDTLHFIAIEAHPFSVDDLRTQLQAWPELANYSQALLQSYPPVLAGFHALPFAAGKVRLTLCFADPHTALNELDLQADLWFPSTLTSFAHTPSPIHAHTHAPWFARPVQRLLATQAPTATIIGGGIAGCQIAHALAIRGWPVQLLECHPQLAREASGNRAGVLTPKMTAEPDWGERFYRQAFLFAIRQLQALSAAGHAIDWDACGALQLNHTAREQKRWQALAQRALPEDFIQLVDADTASALAGVTLPTGGSFFPQGGWLYPASLCAALCEHPAITRWHTTEALQLQQVPDGWNVLNGEGKVLTQSGVVVLANGKDIARFEHSHFLPFMPVRGQTSQVRAKRANGNSPRGHGLTETLRITLGHEGYLTPAINGLHIFGASFERNQTESTLTTAADAVNWQQLAHYLPDFAAGLGEVESSHCAIRMTTPDRYPCVGALPDATDFRRRYADLRHGRQHANYPMANYQPGLFVSGGYGSRGLTTSALCSEMLAALINQEPLPIEKSLYYKLHPARFLVRSLQQGRT